ncbi:MAG: hypothetical protein PHH59_08895 [Methylovulum sp.]|uniref:hypothetical protein n=1 Tax=Methylovulum sp. TaxID=1916980 RepID=UPI0026156A5D|nr:hypothetical protein [Methylovulum sp.]MDD2724120.1 hypothetical protein [Methylovulum sp.]MDD5124618.1 hypothetical protein [Methylovulum sp.]
MLTINKTALSALLAIGLFGAAQVSIAGCIQDQYGNQYTLTVDGKHNSITGTAVMAQCSGEVWPVIGSNVIIGSDKNYNIQEITTIKPQGSTSSCVDFFMLKGTYPSFSWYYGSGYGAQASKFVACGSPTIAPAAGETGNGAVR